MSDPATPPESASVPAPVVEEGPRKLALPRAEAQPPELTPEQILQRRMAACASELQELLQRHGMQIHVRIETRRVGGGGLLCDTTWGISPIGNPAP